MKLHNGKEVFYTFKNGKKQGDNNSVDYLRRQLCVMCEVKVTNTDVFFCACMSAEELSFWPSEVALPFIPAPCSGVVRNICLGIWFAELGLNGLPGLDSSCDLDDSVVWTSIFQSERTLPS